MPSVSPTSLPSNVLVAQPGLLPDAGLRFSARKSEPGEEFILSADSAKTSPKKPPAETQPLAKSLLLGLLGIRKKVQVPDGPGLKRKLTQFPRQVLDKVIQAASLALSLLSMGALFFIPGINLLTPMGIVLAMGVLALNEGVAVLADKRGVKTLHSGALISDVMSKPGEWAIHKGMGLLPNILFGDLKGTAKEASKASLLEKNRLFSQTLAKSLEHTPMFSDVSQDLRNRPTVAGKAWVLLRSVGGLLPSIVMAKFLPGKKGALINMLMYNIFGTKIHQDPEALIKKKSL